MSMTPVSSFTDVYKCNSPWAVPSNFLKSRHLTHFLLQYIFCNLVLSFKINYAFCRYMGNTSIQMDSDAISCGSSCFWETSSGHSLHNFSHFSIMGVYCKCGSFSCTLLPFCGPLYFIPLVGSSFEYFIPCQRSQGVCYRWASKYILVCQCLFC